MLQEFHLRPEVDAATLALLRREEQTMNVQEFISVSSTPPSFTASATGLSDSRTAFEGASSSALPPIGVDPTDDCINSSVVIARVRTSVH